MVIISEIEHPLSKTRRSATYDDDNDDDDDTSVLPDTVLTHILSFLYTDDDRDHISELPDAVLTHILSFLDSKTSVATSVLSKRWNHLWTSVPNLDFGKFDCSFVYHESRTIYLDFVDRVLSLNNVLSVRKLRLHCDQVSHSQRDAWMTSVAKRKFEKIDLRLYTGKMYRVSDKMYRVPDSIFNQKYLVKLKLQLCTKVPQMVCFPCLETIHLYYMQLHDDDSMKNLLSGCPVLRNLYLTLYGWEDASTLYICSPTLHILHLHTNCPKCRWKEEDSFKVVINAPNVIDFHLINVVGVSYYKVDVSSVVKLYLQFYIDDEMSFELLTDLPMFQNLIHLTLDMDDDRKWQLVPQPLDWKWQFVSFLLDCTPNLVSFALVSNDYCPCYWNEPDEVPHCMLSCLESVKIVIPFSDSKAVMMISYILKNANVLKKMSIHTWYDKYYRPAKESAFVKTLLTMPRSSTSCQVYYQDVAII